MTQSVKMIFGGKILWVLFFLFVFSAVWAEDKIEISADAQFEFALHCILQGEYEKAASEFERFIYFFPKDKRHDEAVYQKGIAYFKGQNYEKAIMEFVRLTESSKILEIDSPKTKAYFQISQAYMKLTAPTQAISNLHNLITLTNDNIKIQDKAYYEMGWIYADGGFWQEAESFFEKIKDQEKYRLKKLSDELTQAYKIPRKNPKLAGALSIIPGGGFLYCERYQDAISAFLFNGGLMFGAYKAFEDDNFALGAVVSLVEAGFYMGNFYGAVSSAHKYNQKQNFQFIQKLKQKARLSLLPQGLGLCFFYEF